MHPLLERMRMRLEVIVRSTKKEGITVIIGNFVAKVGKVKLMDERRNLVYEKGMKAGDRLLEPGQCVNFVIVNT